MAGQLPLVQQTGDIPPPTNNLVTLGLIRDIDLIKRGIYLIPANGDRFEMPSEGKFFVWPCSSKVFNLGGSAMTQPDLQEEVLRRGIVLDAHMSSME